MIKQTIFITRDNYQIDITNLFLRQIQALINDPEFINQVPDWVLYDLKGMCTYLIRKADKISVHPNNRKIYGKVLKKVIKHYKKRFTSLQLQNIILLQRFFAREGKNSLFVEFPAVL